VKIAVYGASGYQGRLVVAELARRGLAPVLVGRSATRLGEAAAWLGIPGPDRRVAASDDRGALLAAFGGCDAVVNCAGPFTPAGPVVVDAAISAGCHYVDTAGEQLYIKKIFDLFAAKAERAGVSVVPAATDGALTGDLIAHLVAELVEPPVEITITHTIVGGGPSRGSLRSVLATAEVFGDGGLIWQDGDWRTGTPALRTAIAFPGHRDATPVVKFPLPEVVTIPRHVRAGRVEGLAEADLGARLATPITAEAIGRMPEGPAPDSRRGQRFCVVVDAVGLDGGRVRGVVSGRDTYGTTAVIAVEAARRLAVEPARVGVLAPAEAFDPAAFLDLLAPHGISWTVETVEARVPQRSRPSIGDGPVQ